MTNVRHRALVAGATLGASALFASSAQAAGTTYTVTTSGDDNPAVACNPDHTCGTLRDAIYAANGDGGNDTIQFASGLANQTITLGSAGALTITAGAITIQNPSAPGLAVSGGGASQVFVNAAPTGTTTTISGLTVEDGNAGSGLGGAIDTPSPGSGGGASLVLSSDVIKNSSALGGAGVDAFGPLTISNSQITGNTAGFLGGGVGAKYPTTITNSVISGNVATYGGGVVSRDGLTISGSQITGNTLPTGGSTYGRGGGIFTYSGSLTVTDTTISGNTTARAGGGIANYSNSGTTLSGLTVSGNSAGSGGGIYVAGTFSGGLRVRGARARFENAVRRAAPAAAARPSAAASTGGPISIANSTISGNTATDGAGVDVPYDGTGQPVTISASTLSANKATPSGSRSALGGGLLIGESGSISSPFELIDSTISGNTAPDGGGVSVGYGSYPVLGTGGSIALNNSTIASNSASASGGGGGIFLSDYMSGSPAAENSATISVFSTIVGANVAAGGGNDLARASGSTSGGFDVSYSLIQQPGSAPLLTQQSVIKGVDAQLGSLTNNGGPTQTMLPAFTSPVIDQGKDSPGLATDQRGDARTVDNAKPRPPGGDGTDIGAVEVAKIPIVAIVEPATSITAWNATLNGKITTNGEAVTWYFQYGTSTYYGKQTSSGSISAGNGQVPVTFKISGLHPHTKYHYRVVGVAANGSTSYSADATFETLTPTIKASPSKVMAGKDVRVHGFAGGCTAGDRVTLISDAFSGQHMYSGRPAVYAYVKSGGFYSVRTTIPKDRSAGRYAITARCGGNSFATTAYLKVTKPAAKVRPVRVIRFTG